MKRPLSLTVQAIYVLISAIQLIFVPNLLLDMLGFEHTSEFWIKVFGVVLLSLAVIYWGIIKSGSADMLRHSMWARFLAGIGFCFLVVSGQAPAILLLLGAIDIITATWSWFELKKL
jgi:hypothetical protein